MTLNIANAKREEETEVKIIFWNRGRYSSEVPITILILPARVRFSVEVFSLGKIEIYGQTLTA